jgi:hypothetical protein
MEQAMRIRQYATIGLAFFSLVGLSEPSYACGGFFSNCPVAGAYASSYGCGGFFSNCPAATVGVGVATYQTSFSYRDWLLDRQISSGAALYNHPCTVSDGLTETVVPCRVAARALGGNYAAGYATEAAVYTSPCAGAMPAADPVVYYQPPVRHEWRHAGYHHSRCGYRFQ